MRIKQLLTVFCFSALILLGSQLLTSMGSRALALNAIVDITPKTFNVNMQGMWVAARIEMPEDIDAEDIDVSTIRLEGLFKAEWSNIEGKKLMVKFDAFTVSEYLSVKLLHMGLSRASTELVVDGKLNDGTQFSGSDTITIMNP